MSSIYFQTAFWPQFCSVQLRYITAREQALDIKINTYTYKKNCNLDQSSG